MWMGASATTGQLYSNFYYNKRLQPQVAYATRVLSGSPNSLVYGYCYDFHLGVAGTFGDGNVQCSVTASTLGDNGNVYKIINKVDDNRTKNFTYDALNRITQGYTNGIAPLATSWGETFTIDAWGNLTNRAGISGKQNTELLSASPASVKNQLPSFGYDAAGNMTSNGSAMYSYDGENRLKSTAGYSYVYDGDGNRVIKCAGTYPTCGTGSLLYWTGAGSDTLAESDLAGTMSAEYLMYLGKRTARRDLPSGTVHYYLGDHLGSISVVTDANGVIQKQSEYSPYGGEIWSSGTDANRYKFTGKERDSESQLDSFTTRSYASALSRFITPDHQMVSTGRLHDRSMWNMYSYARNNPLSYLDWEGLEAIVLGYFWQTDWIATARTFAPGDLLAGFERGMEGGRPVENKGEYLPNPHRSSTFRAPNLLLGTADSHVFCPPSCSSEYSALTHGYSIVADIRMDPTNSAKDVATISEVLDPMTGQMGNDYRWTSSGPPDPEEFNIRISTLALSKLSDKALEAVNSTLQSTLGKQGLDEALWNLMVRTTIERGRRSPKKRKNASSDEDDE